MSFFFRGLVKTEKSARNTHVIKYRECKIDTTLNNA